MPSVPLYIPNLIGYGRIILAFLSFYYMPFDHVKAMWCYFISVFLDALDGHAARYFHQASRFGAMLDMLTDRMSTLGLIITLCFLYPACTLLFEFLIILDIVAHWAHMQVQFMGGKSSHKSIDLNGSRILRLYYVNRPFLFTMCAGNELFYLSLYLAYFQAGPLFMGYSPWYYIAIIAAPISIGKSLISLIHLVAAFTELSRMDTSERE